MRRGIQIGFVLTLAIMAGSAMIAVENTRALVEVEKAAATSLDLPAEVRAILSARAEDARVSARRTLISFGLATALALAALLSEFAAFRRDTRRRERAARELLDQRERYRTTLASIADGVIVTDAAGRVTFLNPVAESLTGWGTDALGRPLGDVFRAVAGHT